jgi:Kef-type K+ transport system membrane component KefB/nucleotide-binding universal stress UspA family protein
MRLVRLQRQIRPGIGNVSVAGALKNRGIPAHSGSQSTMRFLQIRPAHFGGPLIVLLLLALFTSLGLGATEPPPNILQTVSSTDRQIGAPAMSATREGVKKNAVAGNGSSGTGRAEGLLIAEIVLLLAAGRILGEAMQRLGQPQLMGNLLAGLVLGPSLFGAIWPQAHAFIFPPDPEQKAMIDGLSQAGILFLLLLTGMETDVKLVAKAKGAAIAISLAGIALPFACGFALGEFLPQSLIPEMAGGRLVPALFLGTALSISSIKIVAMVVREMDFMRRNLGQVIVATAIIEDTAGWVIIAITFGIAGAGGVNALDLAKTVGGVALFMAFCFTAGRWLIFSAIRWVNDNFRGDFPVLTVIIVIMGTMALITQLLGIRTVLGAFMAGVLIGQSPILTDHIQQQLRGMITAFFMPIFFGLSGLAADLTILKDPMLALITGGLVVVASIGKFSGAFVGSMVGGLKWREGVALGCAMNARGSTEVIVASIGLSMGALTQNVYTMIVTMAVITTMAMPPTLRAALSGLPMDDTERKRVERERLDEKGFVPNLERLLLAADASPVGRMAARMAGLLAGGHGMPVTILKLEPDLRDKDRDTAGGGEGRQEHALSGAAQDADSGEKEMVGAQSTSQSAAEQAADPLAKELKTGAKASAAKAKKDEAEPDPEKVHLTTRLPIDKPADVVRDEARKGYDLLFIGIEKARDKDGNIAPEIAELAAGFDGPLALLSGYSGKGVPQLSSRTHILLPVNGSPASRRAAEVGFVLARAIGARVNALYVSQTDGRARIRSREEQVLKDIAQLAERYGVRLSTQISKRRGAGEAILSEARRGYDMIVMGGSPRPGEELFFGSTPTMVFRDWENPLLIIAS